MERLKGGIGKYIVLSEWFVKSDGNAVLHVECIKENVGSVWKNCGFKDEGWAE